MASNLFWGSGNRRHNREETLYDDDGLDPIGADEDLSIGVRGGDGSRRGGRRDLERQV
jgi:hypothetical protein